MLKCIVLENNFNTVVVWRYLFKLAQRDLALRGEGNDEGSNFFQIRKTRAEVVPELKEVPEVGK